METKDKKAFNKADQTNELLLQLIKKLESGEIILLGTEDKAFVSDLFLEDRTAKQKIFIGTVSSIDCSDESCMITTHNSLLDGFEEDKEKNNEFKEQFYKSKGVNCWISNCQNKILAKDRDHKKVKIPCSEKHTRLVCLEHSKEYE